MDIEYRFRDINKKGMLYGVGDLIKYYADVSLRVREKMTMLKQQKRLRDMFTTYLRNQTGVVGITVDSVFQAVETTLENNDIFYFTVEDIDLCNWIKDKKDVTMEIHIDENYFTTQLLLSNFMPTKGFRKRYDKTIDGEKQKWMDWFECEWKKDIKFKGFNNPRFEKEIKVK